MRAVILRLTAVMALLALAACADRETIVLLEDDGGHVGAVTVTTGDAEPVTIDKPLQTAALGTDGQLRVGTTTLEKVQEDFGDALNILPDGSVSFTLYFITGTTDLTEESKPQLPSIFAEIDRRPAPEVVVIGHTDTAGRGELNDRLSLRRAEAVAQWLIAEGIDPEILTTAGRGERELLVQTEDNVSESQNRRVEILVR